MAGAPDVGFSERVRTWLQRSPVRGSLLGLVLLVTSLAAVRMYTLRERGQLTPTDEERLANGEATAGPDDWATVDSAFVPEDEPALVAAGQKTYSQFCVACHGPLPGGAQPLGPVLDAREYLAFASNRRIDSLIVHGIPGTAMVAWGKRRGGMLDDAQLRGLVYYIRSLEANAPSVPTWRNGRREEIP